MIQSIILSSISIIVGFIYLKWIYKRNKDRFFYQEDDSFSKIQTLKGWFTGITLIVVGILFLLKSII